ncbi:MAG: patatin-like phospholipase family protein [Nocardioides sp.]|jgi:NTE family protein
MTRTALVLGGGGITGIAWEIGMLKAFHEAGLKLGGADEILGTSAGSVVGGLISSHPIDDLYDAQLEPPDAAVGGRFSLSKMARALPTVGLPGGSIVARRARVGRAAMQAVPIGSEDRVAVIRERVEIEDWPSDANLRVTAMSAMTGALKIFDRESGVDVIEAIAASCAVPFVWPAVMIQGHPYFDGGVRSTTNADKVQQPDVAVVIAPIPMNIRRHHNIKAQLDRAGVSRRAVIWPDKEARDAIGRNVLNPARQSAAARAGLRQGRLFATRVRAVWPS